MGAREAYRRIFLGREVAVAFVVLASLYLIRFIRFQPLQIPAYLLIVAYDVIELALPALNPYHPIGFPLFLYLLALLGAGITRWLQTTNDAGPVWSRPLGGVCLVVGVLSLGFGAFVGGPLVSPADNPTPLATTGTTGVVLLLAGWWLLRRPFSKSKGR